MVKAFRDWNLDQGMLLPPRAGRPEEFQYVLPSRSGASPRSRQVRPGETSTGSRVPAPRASARAWRGRGYSAWHVSSLRFLRRTLRARASTRCRALRQRISELGAPPTRRATSLSERPSSSRTSARWRKCSRTPSLKTHHVPLGLARSSLLHRLCRTQSDWHEHLAGKVAQCSADVAGEFSITVPVQTARNGEFQEGWAVASGRKRVSGESGRAMKP